MNGLKLYLQSAGHADIQEQFYNGWTHDHYVTSVFCFCPDGTIPIAFFNIPGSVHDSQVAEYGNIYNKLERVFLSTGAKCCVDSAFGNVAREFLYKSCQDHLNSSAPTHELRKLDLRKKRGDVGSADSGVGNAHDTNIFSSAEGPFGVLGERGAENIPKDDGIDI